MKKKTVISKIGSQAGHLLINARVDKETYEKRIEICNKCDNLTITRQCKLCKCFVDAKALAEMHFDVNLFKAVRTKCDADKW